MKRHYEIIIDINISTSETRFFPLHYISCKENKCWKKFQNYEKIVVLIILSIHIMKLEISGGDTIPLSRSHHEALKLVLEIPKEKWKTK
jgi:hypothetical protein